MQATTLLCVIQSAKKLTKKPMYNASTKDIEVHHHNIRELMQNRGIEVFHCKSKDQVTDYL